MAEPVFVEASSELLSPRVIVEAHVETTQMFHHRSFLTRDGRVPTLSEHTSNIETAFALLTERFDAVRGGFDDLNASEARDRWLIPLLGLLDFAPVFQRAHLQAHPDEQRTFAISHLGWDAPSAPPLLLAAGDLTAAAGRRHSVHEELQEFLNLAPQTWGIAASATELRLLRDFHHSRKKVSVTFDLRGIFEARDFPAFRALYRLCHVSRFLPRDDRPMVLDDLFHESRQEGVPLGRDLQQQVRSAVESLGSGLLTPELREGLPDGASARAFYRELLLTIYRILFMLFAEQQGMLPADGPYAETYSMTRLREVAEQGLADPHHEDLWEGLKASFRLLSQGGAGVFPYDSRLFDPAETPTTSEGSCANRHVLSAVRALTTVELGGLTRYVNYAHLGVEEMGPIYQSLLPYALRVDPRGNVHLAPVATEQRDLGVHYTPSDLVDFVLEVSLDRLMEERLSQAGPDPDVRQRALLDIRVLDPACGSGTFLIGAIDRLAEALAGVRAGGEKPTEDQVRTARRDVLQHCIYGVDKDAFAVELCRVSLWFHCAVPGLPLTFLDQRIQQGDSLVGWDLLRTPAEIPVHAYAATSKITDRAQRRFLASARARNRAVLNGQITLDGPLPEPDVVMDFPDLAAEDERVPADVARKTRVYAEYLESEAYRRWRAAADLWTAAFFWGPDSGDPPTSADYWLALHGEADLDLAARAATICERFPSFHWPIRFPEIASRGGFDCIVGNPPWEQFESREDEWFQVMEPSIAGLTGSERKDRIDALAKTDPALHREWLLHTQTNERLAEYSRSCGRFTEPGGKANTYLLFTELAASLLRRDGRAGLIVKTALAVDRGGQAVFQTLLSRGQVEELHDIVNGGATGADLTFRDVDDKERFCVLGLRGPRSTRDFSASVLNWNVKEARERHRQRFDQEMLRTLNQRTRSLTSFRTRQELEVALAVHSARGTLDFDEDNGKNPWQLTYVTLFNSTTDHKRFWKREQLEPEGWELGRDRVFRRQYASGDAAEAEQLPLLGRDSAEVEVALPVYEGQLANRYDHRAKTYEGFTGPKKYGRAPGIDETTDQQKADPWFEVEPRYWMLADDLARRSRATSRDRVMIGFRDVSRPWREQRTAKGTIIPRVAATDTLPVLVVPTALAIEFLAVFNSTTFDFLVRGHMPGAHVKTVWMLSQIAAPEPGLDPRIAAAARRLSLTSWSVARLFGVDPHPWDAEERRQLDVWIDAMIAHAYGLTEAQYTVVLDSFEVMAREQISEHGRYRFKEDCLAAYRNDSPQPAPKVEQEPAARVGGFMDGIGASIKKGRQRRGSPAPRSKAAG